MAVNVSHWVGSTIVVIHSRACTVPCQTTPRFDPLPPLPQMWIPLMSRPSTDLPAEITSALFGYAAARSVIHCMWSAMEWYELNHVALGAAPASIQCKRHVHMMPLCRANVLKSAFFRVLPHPYYNPKVCRVFCVRNLQGKE